jgi:phosphate transport system substrate-binding protein
MRKLTVSLLLIVSVFLFTACPQPSGSSGSDGTPAREMVTMKGSDTMLQVGQRWAELYMKAHPEVTIQVTGQGTGTGIAALIDGTTQICQASRPLKDAERESIKTKRMVDAMETPVALDALAIYVNKDNPITSLTIEQAGKIFRGEVTNWKDVGGKAGNIVLYGRENSSGTYVYFKDHVLGGKDFPAKYQALSGTGAIVNAIAKDAGGIGYGGSGYATQNKTYPLSRELFWFTAGPATGATKAFQEWVLSAEGQKVVEEQGFYPLAH